MLEHEMLSRCSICFDNHQDFCVDPCGDQFCEPCFTRYVEEVLALSWASLRPITCPVCHAVMHSDQWQAVPRS